MGKASRKGGEAVTCSSQKRTSNKRVVMDLSASVVSLGGVRCEAGWLDVRKAEEAGESGRIEHIRMITQEHCAD